MFGLFNKKKENTAESEINPVPEAERRIYIIDFDRTITILHTGGLAYGNELSAEFIQRNIKKGFADFVRKIMGYGHKIYIATYNDDANADIVAGEALSGHALIKYYMDLEFGRDQDLFTISQKNEAGEIVSAGNIIARNSQDLKQYHLDTISSREGMDQKNPDDMKQIYLLEDDEDVVRHYSEKGCTTIVPVSASRSADTAATKTLFTVYMPESFIA
ncbi:MAG: hypothetical protein JRF02_00225 [Deltaproteobacteria bacterium]|jgi:hypothetical protein|nr:hypothetical protein [Deltaproteobacteria bacterium]